MLYFIYCGEIRRISKKDLSSTELVFCNWYNYSIKDWRGMNILNLKENIDRIIWLIE